MHTNNKQHTYTENDLPDNLDTLDHVYIQTKLQGEHQVIKYKKLGLNCNIYRVGNLAFMSENYRAQKNIDDNSFYNWLKYLFTIEYSTEIINTVEISQTDLTAKAITKIFCNTSLSNQIYHVFNPYLFDMTDVLKRKNFKILSIGKFVDRISQRIIDGKDYGLMVKFLLHQGWLDWWEEQNTNRVKVLQEKTQHILKKIRFWMAANYRKDVL